MKIRSITIRNFRCFGETPVTVEISDGITALVGANGSGKTAILIALTRMFGPTQGLRTIRHSDFHKSPATSSDQHPDTDLSIEVTLSFPELEGDDIAADVVPSVFNQMIVNSPSGELYCRLRLEARWVNDGTVEGDVEQHLYWLQTAEDPVPDDDKKRVFPADRGRIQVHYIPANRDPAPEFRNAARNRVGRLVRDISWEQQTRDSVQIASESIRDALGSEQAVGVINGLLQHRWEALRDEYAAASTELRFAGSGFEEIVRDIGVVFPENNGTETDLAMLSEGQQSLFYLALVAAVFDVEGHIVDHNHSEVASGFQTDRFVTSPDLVIFALEEPENHLAPHYLGRIIRLLRSLTSTGRAQTIFSSHSPSVLRRVFPEEIRHLRRNEPSRTSVVSQIILPGSAEESSKFVREAVMAYPELYFGKFVILAEGPSEEVVLPKIAAAAGLQIDTSFISVVPLGGRHVNHFWRLLAGLKIPHATLLDLDAGRSTGGWARIKYVCQQLLLNGADTSVLLEFEAAGQSYRITEEGLETLQDSAFDAPDICRWINHLENFGVFFSAPLDFDWSMLSHFPDAYKNIDGQRGPTIPAEESSEWDEYIRGAIGATVGNDEDGIAIHMNTASNKKELFAWYRYLFLSRSKPTTHILALSGIEEGELREKSPPRLRRLLNYCEEKIAQ